MKGETLRVLLIEDNPGDVGLIKRMLAGHHHVVFALQICETLAEGLAQVRSTQYDAVLLDLGLPDSQGLDTLRRFRTAAPDLPIIVFTGLTEEESAIEAVRNGAQDYLVKAELNAALLTRTIRYSIVRKHMETALWESQQKYQELFDHAPIGYHELDTEGRITRVNRTELEMLGYTAEEMVGRPIWDFIVEAAQCRECVLGMLRGTMPPVGQFERTMKRKDGTLLPVLIDGRVLRDAAGRIIGIRSTVQDITERKRAEARLQEQSHLNKILLDHIPCRALLLRPKTYEIVVANIVAQKEGAVPGKKCFTMWGTQAPCSRCRATEIWESGRPHHLEFEEHGRTWEAHWIPVREDLFLHYIFDVTERKRVQAQIQRQVQQLEALRTIDMAITGSLDLRVTLSVFLDAVTRHLNVDAAAVLLLNPHSHMLEYRASRGFRTRSFEHVSLHLGEGHAGIAAIERRLIQIRNLAESPGAPAQAEGFLREGFVSYYAVPLIVKGQVEGVLEIFFRTPHQPEPDWLDFLQSLAGQAAIAIDSASLFDELQRKNIELIVAYDTTLAGWSRALDLRHKETQGHTERVTEMAVRLARQMGLSETELVHLRRGALLHDIGKLGVPDNILLKPASLTREERAIIRKHPQYAYDLLSPIPFLRQALEIPYCHHENWDGTGYPRRIKGEAIPLSARIFAVVDTWDALRSDRPYRKAFSEEETRQYLRKQAGKHFDPRVVEQFLAMLDRDKVEHNTGPRQ